MNPMNVASARTARLVREASTPVYSTVTPVKKREHRTMIEIESDMGGRHWVGPFYTAEAQRKEIEELTSVGYWISDIDCPSKCWCVK